MSVAEMLRKFPYIGRARNIRLRHDYIEIDAKFLKDLAANPKAAEFYNQFIKEAINADLRDAKLYKEKSQHTKIFYENNARNRCAYNRAKVSSNLFHYNEKANKPDEEDKD